MHTVFCNNCGKIGHQYHQCRMPITSYGIVVFCIMPNSPLKFLMIRRKDSLGYVDFVRGKFPLNNKQFILNMLDEMTVDEKHRLSALDFKTIWTDLWGIQHKYDCYPRLEEKSSAEKLAKLRQGCYISGSRVTLSDLMSSIKSNWIEPEWGFPKGRRNQFETDIECAVREWVEETGYSSSNLDFIDNILPFEEIFVGSNYKSYKHKYFIAQFNVTADNLSSVMQCDSFQYNEVGKMEWKTFDDAVQCIRPYNEEKIRVLTNINHLLSEHILYKTCLSG